MIKVITLSVMFVLFSFSKTVLSEQVIQSTIPDNWPDDRYELNNDGTLVDLFTGLMWKQCPEGMIWKDGTCDGTLAEYNWLTAHEAALQADFANYDDWRVPNIKELLSLTAYNRRQPAMNIIAFPDIDMGLSSKYISSTRITESKSATNSIQVTYIYIFHTLYGRINREQISSAKSGLLLVRGR